jgi:hypothetical protein
METWIDEPPSVLSIQLNRVVYDVEKTAGIKKHTPFDFRKTIYIDRFMYINREHTLSLRSTEL